MTQAMRGFASWVTARSYRLILLAIVLVQPLPLIASALLVLDALWRGPRASLITALLASAAFFAIGLALDAGAVEAAAVVLPLLLGAASGALLAWSRSLSLAFQITVLAFVALALASFALVADPVQLGTLLLDEVRALLGALGLEPAQIEQLVQFQPLDATSALLASVLASTLAAVLLGRWWHSLIAAEVEFGPEFRALKLGKVAAVLLLTVLAGSLVLPVPAIDAVALAALVGFLFQGLAVLHARRLSEGWHSVVLVLVYLSLVSPLVAPWAYLGVSSIGLLDNFFSLRAPAGQRG
jgi:hypothetical protein